MQISAFSSGLGRPLEVKGSVDPPVGHSHSQKGAISSFISLVWAPTLMAPSLVYHPATPASLLLKVPYVPTPSVVTYKTTATVQSPLPIPCRWNSESSPGFTTHPA